MNNPRLKNFLLRSISSLLLVPIFLLMLWYNQWTYFIIFSVIHLSMLYEFYTIFSLHGYNKILGSILGGTIYTSIFLYCTNLVYWKIFVIPYSICLISIFGVLVKFSTQRANLLSNIGIVFLGVAYITLPIALMNFLVIHNSSYNHKILIGIFLCIWSTDTAAYITGTLIGKHKCFKNISPNKTVEGFIGGIIASIITAFILKDHLFENQLAKFWYILGLLIGIGGVLGDLFESFIKRSFNIKDSGNVIPGHGGLLDRFDSFLLVISLVFIFNIISN